MKKLRCNAHDEDNKRCPNPYFGSIRVKVRHSDTGRSSSQTWHMCKVHFIDAIADQMKGYYSEYPKKPGKKAFVIDYKVISKEYNFYLNRRT